MLKTWGVQKKKPAPKKALKGERPAELTVELLNEPEDRMQPDTSAVFQALKNVETLPHIRALKRMRVHPCAQGEATFDCDEGSSTISKILRSLLFWKQ